MAPSKQAVERVNAASERMRQAHQECLAFTELPDKTFSYEELAETNRLLRILQQSIEDYGEAFNAAAAEDPASRD